MDIQKLINDFEDAVRHTDYSDFLRTNHYYVVREALEKALQEAKDAKDALESLKNHYEQLRLDI